MLVGNIFCHAFFSPFHSLRLDLKRGMKTPRKKPVNGKQKGKAGELELAAFLREHGIAARRGQQYCGASGDADVVHAVPWLHIECKRVERLNLRAAMVQATRDASAAPGCPRTAVVCHRGNREPWMVTLPLEAFLAIVSLVHVQDD